MIAIPRLRVNVRAHRELVSKAAGQPKQLARAQRSWWRLSYRTRLALGIVAGVLLALRLYLPFGIQRYVNHQLQRSKDYSGYVGDITVHLWRGAYQIHGARIFKQTGNIRVPFFTARMLDLSIEWKELFHGSVVGEVSMQEPKLNFVSGPTETETQTGKEVAWDEMLKSLFPFRLNRLELKQAQIHFQNQYSTPPVDIYLEDISAVATNLSNARDTSRELPAGVEASGRALGDGRLDLHLLLNPMTPQPTFELVCEVTNVDLVALNPFLLAYGKFDVERGTFGLYASIAAKDGKYEGYFKPFFADLDVFNWQKEKNKNALKIAWQAVVGALTTIFKNHIQDSLATKVPVSGTFDKGQVGVWSAVGNLLRHAFIQALVPRVDEQVKVEEIPPKTGKEK